MMNKRIRSMIDEIFSEMKMTAENLALRDELLANAQARYEDVIASGKAEEEAFAEVAASLEDVNDLLHEMNAGAAKTEAQAEEAPRKKSVVIEMNIDTGKGESDSGEKDRAETGEPVVSKSYELDLGDTLNKAFSALGSFGKSIMPQAKKFVREMDDATGGKLGDMGRAVNKGVKDAKKAAGETIDRMSDMTGELVFDFGKREAPKKAQGKTPDELREEAKDLRAEAGFKAVTGDQAGADELNAKADALETQADALEQAQAMEEAAKAAAEEAVWADDADDVFDTTGWSASPADLAEDEDVVTLEEKHQPLLDDDGDVNEDAFTKVVEQIQRETERVLDGVEEKLEGMLGDDEAPAQDAEYTVTGETTAAGSLVFPANGLRAVDIELDADDVRIESCEGSLIETVWSAQNVEGEPEIVMEGHKLKIRRKNPDVFKTFFSVFSKNGGQITVRVPHGCGAEYKVNTTSGDIVLDEVDVESVKANSTSGSIRLEPDAAVRAVQVNANTVSGDITVSACAEEVKVNTVSGRQFVSCDALKVKADTVSGKVHIEGACDTWDVDSVSGSVELMCTDVPGRKIDIDTVSASATVMLPGNIRGFVAKFSGMGGKLINEFGPDRYGTCALPVHMESMSGSLRITKL